MFLYKPVYVKRKRVRNGKFSCLQILLQAGFTVYFSYNFYLWFKNQLHMPVGLTKQQKKENNL
jgi:hypothetical protein